MFVLTECRLLTETNMIQNKRIAYFAGTTMQNISSAWLEPKRIFYNLNGHVYFVTNLISFLYNYFAFKFTIYLTKTNLLEIFKEISQKRFRTEWCLLFVIKARSEV